MRCGENPHQQAALYRTVDGADCTRQWTIRTNPDRMSFNNHVDADAAYVLARELSLAGGANGNPAAWSPADELQRQLLRPPIIVLQQHERRKSG